MQPCLQWRRFLSFLDWNPLPVPKPETTDLHRSETRKEECITFKLNELNAPHSASWSLFEEQLIRSESFISWIIPHDELPKYCQRQLLHSTRLGSLHVHQHFSPIWTALHPRLIRRPPRSVPTKSLHSSGQLRPKETLPRCGALQPGAFVGWMVTEHLQSQIEQASALEGRIKERLPGMWSTQGWGLGRRICQLSVPCPCYLLKKLSSAIHLYVSVSHVSTGQQRNQAVPPKQTKTQTQNITKG